MIPDHEVVARRVPKAHDDPPQATERHFRQRHYDDRGVLRREDHYAIREVPLPPLLGSSRSPLAWLAIGIGALMMLLLAYAVFLLLTVAAIWYPAYVWGPWAGVAGLIVSLAVSLYWGPGGPIGVIAYQVLMSIGVLVAGWAGMLLALPFGAVFALIGWSSSDP